MFHINILFVHFSIHVNPSTPNHDYIWSQDDAELRKVHQI